MTPRDPAGRLPARSSIERMRRLGIHPNRELGQNFLVDDNVLEVIGRVAELDPGDVVLEIGGGLGALSEFLAERVRHLHVVETDPRLEPALREALANHDAGLVMADVMTTDLRLLDPPPSKVVANLPYGVAVPAIIRTIEQLPSVGLWCVMVQREIADRLATGPGSRVYGIPSVIVQLACSVKLVRAVSRSVFHPPPHVDSALVRLRRTGPAAAREVAALVHGAFAHRRKALARSLELALCAPGLRPAARQALQELGHPPDERAERLSPPEFAALAERLAPWLAQSPATSPR
jgi:16S rRNA (adenine1518-N6/adenine1519-N6)-dimethyltransferase